MINYDDKLWCIGGFNQNFGLRSDIWYSTNGLNWKLRVNNSGSFGKRTKHTVSIFNNKMMVIGGTSDTGLKNDVGRV